MSRIGKQPIAIPPKVKVEVKGQKVHVEGPKGKLDWELPRRTSLKVADGKMMTHAAGSEVNMTLLANLASELGAPSSLRDQILAANTARHVLELCAAANLVGVTTLVCRRVVEHARRHTDEALDVAAYLVDFNGALLGRYPEQETGDE